MNGKKALFAAAAISGLIVGGAALSSDALAKSKGKGHGKSEHSTEMGECHGVNACNGQGACGGAGNPCAGHNECKGKGWLKMSAEQCAEKGGKFKS